MFDEFGPDKKVADKKADDRRIEGYLGHWLSTGQPQFKNGQSIRETRYATYHLSFPRPETGEGLQTVACPNCGAKLSFRIRSRKAVGTERLKLLSRAVLATALGLVFFRSGAASGWTAALDLACLLAIIWGLATAGVSLNTYGLAVEMKRKGSGGHKLFKNLKGLAEDPLPGAGGFGNR